MGYTIQNHVGFSDADLKARLTREPKTTAVSTFTDREAAEHAIATALDNRDDEIKCWLSTNRERLRIECNLDFVVGRTLARSGSKPISGNRIFVVLLRNSDFGTGYQIHTGFLPQ